MPDYDKIQEPKKNVTLEAQLDAAMDEVLELESVQCASEDSFRSLLEETVNPFARVQKMSKDIKANKSRIQKLLKGGKKEKKLIPIERIRDFAQQFQQRNQELKATVLITLRDLIKPGDSKETVLKKIIEFYQDVSLADEVLDFLIETTEGELEQTVREAKDEFNARYGREITAGRNIAVYAREAADQGLGTPTNLRELYRNITGEPRDSTTLFHELSQKYVFKDLKKVIDFLLHSLGADMKSKGPSIPRGQLHRLITETRSLQAILGVYRFFKGRMPLVDKLFQKEGIEVPQNLTFETISKQFMSLAAERFPSADKVLQTGVRLGVDKWITAKIIVLSQFRDAVREVAVSQVYRSIQHRDELYMAIIEALEDLEDELEELLEEEREEEEE